MSATETAPTLTLIRPRQLAELLGISQPTIWRLRQRGEFPPPVQITRGCIGWRSDVIAEWLRSRETTR